MQVGEHIFDTKTQLRTRCELSLLLDSGHKFFTARKSPMATATLMPDGKTLDITIWVERLVAAYVNSKNI